MIDPRAIVSPDAQIADDVAIGPFAVIGPGVRIGAGTWGRDRRCQLLDGCLHVGRRHDAERAVSYQIGGWRNCIDRKGINCHRAAS